MEEQISVVITTYGRNSTLKRALRSVVVQTYRNLEIIVVDDNANIDRNEEVASIVRKLNDPRIKLIRNQSNLGGALARNVGIEASTSDYVAFLDDDDEYLSEKIEKEYNVIKKKDSIALVYCWENLIGKNGAVTGCNKKTFKGNCVYESMQDCIAATSLWLCKKSALKEVEGFTDTPCKQDSYLILKLLLRGYEVDYVPEVLSLYGDDLPNRISTQGHEKRILGEENLRSLCRENYSLLDKKQQKKVEYCFSMRLAEHYWAVGRRRESLQCFAQITQHPFNWMTRACIKGMVRNLVKE